MMGNYMGRISPQRMEVLKQQGLVPLRSYLNQRGISRTTFYRLGIPAAKFNGLLFVHAESANKILTDSELAEIRRVVRERDEIQRAARVLAETTNAEAEKRSPVYRAKINGDNA